MIGSKTGFFRNGVPEMNLLKYLYIHIP